MKLLDGAAMSYFWDFEYEIERFKENSDEK